MTRKLTALVALMTTLTTGILSAADDKKKDPDHEARVIAAIEFLKTSDAEKEIAVRASLIENDEIQKEALARIRKDETPAEKKARKEFQKDQHRLAERAKYAANAEAFSAVSGCDPGTVIVNPDVAQYDRWYAQVTIRVVNTKDFPVDIESSYKGIGVGVRNLCPGGSVSMAFSLKYAESLYHQSVSIYLTARGRGDGKEVFTRTSPLYLYQYSNSYVANTQRDDRVWEIR